MAKIRLFYFSTSSIIVNFCSMLKQGGCMLIAAETRGNWHSGKPKFYEFIDKASYSLSTYFYNTGNTESEVFCNLHYLEYVRHPRSFKRQQNQVSVLKEQISPKIPFVTEFFDQNEPLGIILSITKK